MMTESPKDRKCSASASPSPLLLPVMTTCGMRLQAVQRGAVGGEQKPRLAVNLEVSAWSLTFKSRGLLSTAARLRWRTSCSAAYSTGAAAKPTAAEATSSVQYAGI